MSRDRRFRKHLHPAEVAAVRQDAAGGPYLESPDALKDPWQQQWQYDKTGPMNGGTKPDIWTTDPKDAQRTKLGNWPASAQGR